MWKLLDYTTITVTKNPQFLQEIQEKVENFHKVKNAVANKLRELIRAPHLARAEPKKQEIVEFTGNESELMKSFLQD